MEIYNKESRTSPKFGNISTHKKNNHYKFVYSYYSVYNNENNAINYIFEIWEEGRENYNKFSFILREMENGEELKVIDMFPDHEKYYLGKGISIVIITEAKQVLKKRIISSSNDNKIFSGEARWKGATKIWEELVAKGFAKYNDESDYYYTL